MLNNRNIIIISNNIITKINNIIKNGYVSANNSTVLIDTSTLNLFILFRRNTIIYFGNLIAEISVNSNNLSINTSYRNKINKNTINFKIGINNY